MVPEGWQSGRVGDFLLLQRGFDLTKAQAEKGNIPVYSSSGIAYWHNQAKCRAPGIITGRKGSVGPVYLVRTDYWPHDTTLWVKDFKGNHVDYIWYFLTALHLERFDEASSVPTLNRNNVHAVKCVFPPLPEQKKIAEILSTWDRAIEVAERQLENARLQKKALMQQLLTGTRRLPGFDGEWKTVKLGDVVDRIIGGGTPSKSRSDFWVGPIPWLSVKDLVCDHVLDTQDYISVEAVKESATNLIAEGSIVVATRMAVGRTVRVGTEMAINQDLKAIIPSNSVSSDFLFWTLKLLEPALERHGTGSTVKGISLSVLRNVEFELPVSPDEQAKVSHVISLSHMATEHLTCKLSHLRTEKRALMQQLLTGKKRVTV